jgi:hypothetical protein
MQAVLNLVWDKLLPACGPKKLRADRNAQTKLKDALARLELAPAPGAATSDLAATVLNRPFAFSANDQQVQQVSVRSTDGGQNLALALRVDGREMTLPAGHRQWRQGRVAFPAGRLAQFPDEPVASTFGWTAADTLEVKVAAYETPFALRYRLKFTGDEVALDSEANVSFGPTQRPTLVGRRESSAADR